MKTRCAVATLALLLTHAAAALPPVRGGVRDARDAHVWFEEQPRGNGVEAMGLRLQPTVPVSARYNDNIFASDARDTGDVIFAITPSLVARPQLGRHEFVAKVYARSDFYAERSRQDNTEVGVGIFGRLDVFDWLDFTVHGNYDDLNEDWDSPDTPLAAAEQASFDQLSGGVAAHLRAGRFTTDVDFTYLEVNVDDVAARGGGVIDQIGRHRDTVDITFEFGWQLTEHLKPFASYRWNDHGYDQAPPRVLVDRDGDGRAILGGLEVLFDEVLTARVYGGHIMQDFNDDDTNLEQAEGVGYGAEIAWQVDTNTHLEVDLLREIEEASEGFESGRFATTLRLRATQRLSDRLMLDAGFGYLERDYVGTAREAETWSGRLGATWQLPMDFYTSLAWRYTERDSNVAGRSYTRHEALLTLGWSR